MKALRNFFYAFMVIIVAVGFMACSQDSDSSGDSAKIGISMPNDDSNLWVLGANTMKTKFENAGYTVDLRYADASADTQKEQLSAMISGGCEVLVITAEDTSSLTEVLESAKSKGVKVITYDRLILNTDAVTYYVGYNPRAVGVMQGKYIVNKLNLESDSTSNVYIEFFTGKSGDNNSTQFFNGAMSVLDTYLNSRVLVCKSSETSIEKCYTAGWSTDEAKSRMAELITGYYSSDNPKVSVVYSANDGLARGITAALKEAGYTSEDFPIITGQDCDADSIKNIIAGYQSMSVFKDPKKLAAKTFEIVDALCQNKSTETDETVNIGETEVSAFYCEPVLVEKSNYKEILIDSGYYTEADLQ